MRGFSNINTHAGQTSPKKTKALNKPRRDDTRVILTDNKGVALVLLDKTEHINKAKELLEDKRKYKEIKTDPTNKYKNRLINLLKKIKQRGIKGTLLKKKLKKVISP